MLTAELARSYTHAVYTVRVNGSEIRLPACGESTELLQLLQLLRAEDIASCALITAFNPHGRKTDAAENQHLQQQFIQAVANRWRYYSATGSDPAGHWPAEPSLLILDIKLEQARELSRVYRQNAFLYGEAGRTKLIAVDASQQPLLDVYQTDPLTDEPEDSMKPDVPLVNIMDLLLDAVCVVDQQGRFVYVSAASERIFGYTPEEMHGRNPLDLVHPDDRAHTAAAISEISAGNAKPYFENRYIRKDGQIAHIMWSARFAPEDQYRVAVAHDISERKYAEFIHKAQYEISEAAHSEDDLQALFKSIHATITEFLTADRFYIALRGGTDEALEYAYYYDVTEQVPEQTPAADTFCVEVMRTDAPLLQISAAIAAGTNNSQLMTSRLGVPLSMNNTTLGALIMQHSSQAMSYSDKDKEFLQFVSTQIATAVERKKLQTQMRYMALHDVLTGLPNRVLFQDRLRLALARARRETALLAVLYLDLDKFKQVNDDFGHAVGDALLQESAQRLRDCLREVDTVARIGGDEFVILLENINRHEDIERVVSKIQAAFMLEFAVENRVLKIAPSIGIAVYPQDGDDDQQLLRHADDAMYAAKPK